MAKKKKHYGLAFVFLFSIISSIGALYASANPSSAFAAFYRQGLDEMASHTKLYVQKVLSGGLFYRGAIISDNPDNYYLAGSEEEYLSLVAAEAALDSIIHRQSQPAGGASQEPLDLPDENGFIYYSQADPRWADALYGSANDPLEFYGCGPTALASVVSSLTDTKITPPEMAKWAFDHGYYSKGSGSYHSLIPDGAKAHGLEVETLSADDPDQIINALQNNRLVVVLMARGHFTAQGHFIVLKSIAEDGSISIADPKSKENSEKTWTLDTIIDEAKRSASAGGPFWSISQPADSAEISS